MKAIETHFVGPSNVRGSRYIASDGDGNRAIVGADHSLNSDANHARAAEALCAKMGWTGKLVGGSTRRGMAFVWSGAGSILVHVEGEERA